MLSKTWNMSKFLQNLETGAQETKYDVFICFWLFKTKFRKFVCFFFLKSTMAFCTAWIPKLSYMDSKLLNLTWGYGTTCNLLKSMSDSSASGSLWLWNHVYCPVDLGNVHCVKVHWLTATKLSNKPNSFQIDSTKSASLSWYQWLGRTNR